MSDENILVLASSSPRRQQLLREAGYDFETVEPSLDESAIRIPADLSPAATAESLAYMKARNVAFMKPGRRILAADTVVSSHGRVIGKPADEQEAASMLRDLSSEPHKVITGVAILEKQDRRLIASEQTIVIMRPMSEEDILEYISTGEWRGKAGAYAIQETADRYIEKVDGSFSNVVGLPMELVEKMNKKMDMVCGADSGEGTREPCETL